MREAEDDLLEALCHIPDVSQLLPRRDGVIALASAVTFTLQLFERNGERDYVEGMKNEGFRMLQERECRQLGSWLSPSFQCR